MRISAAVIRQTSEPAAFITPTGFVGREQLPPPRSPSHECHLLVCLPDRIFSSSPRPFGQLPW